MDGWLKLYRKIMDSPVFNDPDMYRLWSLCLFKASYTEREIAVGRTIITLQPGEFVTGRDALEGEYNRNMKPSKRVPAITLWRMMKTLEEWGKLNIKSTNKYSVISIANWAFYQMDDQQNDQLVISERSANDQLVITNKKERSKEEKKQYAEFVSMTETEHAKLVSEIGEVKTADMIDQLDNYIGRFGKQKKYKDHYRTIKNWLKRDADSKPQSKTPAVKNAQQTLELLDQLDRGGNNASLRGVSGTSDNWLDSE